MTPLHDILFSQLSSHRLRVGKAQYEVLVFDCEVQFQGYCPALNITLRAKTLDALLNGFYVQIAKLKESVA